MALASLSLVLIGATARAAANDLEIYIGADLYTQCSAGPADADFQTRQARCFGYVIGVSDALQAQQGRGGAASVCYPTTIATAQVVAGVSAFLEAHPEKRQFSAQDLVSEALAAAFPCK
ncbi:MAG: Rap1a/Tai family immunity protein [Caulobacterales bacterium]